MQSPIFQNEYVTSNRIIYTPSEFAKSSLLYLQETGELKAQRPHTKSRSGLDSYLFFIVLSGAGELRYNDKPYPLKKNSCIFIDCRQAYAHVTSDDLWKLKWVHFNGHSMTDIYNKYLSRGGEPTFEAEQPEPYDSLLDEILNIASSDDYIRDMKLNEKLASLLTLIMSKSWHPGKAQTAKKRGELSNIKSWMDTHYSEKISLDEISRKKITAAKQLLRFSDKSIEQIGFEIGISDTNYFTRLFKKIEGITPGEYRKRW